MLTEVHVVSPIYGYCTLRECLEVQRNNISLMYCFAGCECATIHMTGKLSKIP